jgi:hypothetical protein
MFNLFVPEFYQELVDVMLKTARSIHEERGK